MSWNGRHFFIYPMETYLVVTGILGGIWFLTHIYTFTSVPQSWTEFQVVGGWFPFGAAAFWGLLRLVSGMLHLLGVGRGVLWLRQFACAFSAIYYFGVAVCMVYSNSSDPSLMEYFILSMGAAYMFLLITMRTEIFPEGDPFTAKL